MQKFASFLTLLFLATTAACTQTAPQLPAQKTIAEKDLTTYLFVYFKDATHSLYFALSRDGYSFTDVNNAQPILLGKDLAEQKGIRDPHIMRGPDGTFYMVMTDLNIDGLRDGTRTTQWERPVELYDWGNNRAIVMMKSTDLITWSHSDFRIDKAFDETKEVGCIWAPETIYDPEKKKLMVYYTMRIAHGPTKLYYSYADDAFTKLETVPVELFKYPTNNQILDADITKIGDQYHMFYVAQGNGGGIKQAVSNSINKDYAFDPKNYDPETVGREAPEIWKRLDQGGAGGADTYVLMVNVFGLRPSNFGFNETTDFKTFKNLGHFNDGVMKATNFSQPKHGAIMAITTEEAKALAAHWKFDFDSLKARILQNEHRVTSTCLRQKWNTFAMSHLVSQIIESLQAQAYDRSLENVFSSTVDLFEKARGMMPAGWGDEALETDVTPDDVKKLREAMVSFIERTGYGSWPLSKCEDQSGLKSVYIGALRRHLAGDSHELYQAMVALMNLGERIFQSSASSIDDPLNRELADRYLKDTN